jgi:hypothetical protein
LRSLLICDEHAGSGGQVQTVCLDNQLWDSHSNEVLGMKLVTDTTYRVGSARYLPEESKTLLTLIGALEGVEIDL